MKALLSNEDQQLIAEILEKITHKLDQKTDYPHGHGLLSGLAGELLFLFKAHQYNASSVNEERFNDRLEALQEALGDQSFELSSGLAGQAWVLEYFNQKDSEDYDPELLEEVDQLFVQGLSHEPWPGEIEMVLGLAGYTPYASRRALFTDQTKLYECILRGFESTLVEVGDKVSWSQPEASVYRFDKECEKEHEFNLGLAHGVPSIIAAILPIVNNEKLGTRAKHLVESSIEWLLEQHNPDHSAHHCFGSCAGDEDDHHSRLGWCYGDLTIALTLLRVGQALDNQEYIAKAREIAIKTTHRDDKSAFINDSGLCHGFYGLAVIYQYFDKLLPTPEISEAAVRWMQYGLNQYRENGHDSLRSFHGVDKEYHEDTGFLMGEAGVGLALIAALDNDIDWFDCLLMA